MINQSLANGIVSVSVDLAQFEAGMTKVRASLASLGTPTGGGGGGMAAATKKAVDAQAKELDRLDKIQDRYFKKDYDRRAAHEGRLQKAREAASAREAADAAKSAAKLEAIQDRYAKRDYDRRIAYEVKQAKASAAAEARGPAGLVGLGSLQMSGIKLQDRLREEAARGPEGLIGLGSLQMSGLKLQDRIAKEKATAAARALAEAGKLDAVQDRYAKRDYDRRIAYESRLEKAKLATAARAEAANARENRRFLDAQKKAGEDLRAGRIRTASSAGMGLMQGLGLGGFSANPAQLAGQAVGGGISMMADGLKDAVANSMDLEQTFTGLQRVSGESAANVDKFKKTIFDIGKTQAGVSVRDLTSISMAGAKAGITDKEGLAGLERFTRGMAQVRNSVQGIGTEHLADDMIKMLNLFHKGTDYVQSFGSVLARMDNVSTSSASDILDMSKSLSGTFASLGMGIPQVMAFSSVLSDVGLTNQQGASSFSQILRMMASKSEELATKIGVPIDVFQQKIRTDAMGALGMLIARFREINEVDPIKAQEFIAGLGFRGVKTAGALQQLSSIFEQVQERTKMAIEEETTLGSLQAANNLNSTTAIANIQKLKNAFEELSDAIGSKVVPHLTEASKVALEMMNRMTGGKEGSPQDITAAERGYRALVKSLPEAMQFPSDRKAVAEIDRKEKAYNDRLNTGAPTLDEQVANLQRSKAGASPATAAKMDDAIAQLKMDQANTRANSPEGLKAAGKAFLEGMTKIPGFGGALGKPEFGGLPGMAYEQGISLADPEASPANIERGKVFGRPTDAEMKGDTEEASRLKRLAGFVQEKQDRVEFGMPKKQFQSQMFSGGDDFAQHMIKEALSDKEDVSKQALEVHKESKKVLDKISSTLLEGTGIRPLTNPVAIMRGGASPP